MSCRCWRPDRPRTRKLPRGCRAVGREGEVWRAPRGQEHPTGGVCCRVRVVVRRKGRICHLNDSVTLGLLFCVSK